MTDNAKLIYEGREYEIPKKFTYRELGLIRDISGVTDVKSAIRALDETLMVALLVVCKRRAGERFNVDQLLDLEVGEIDAREEEEPAEDPPQDDTAAVE